MIADSKWTGTRQPRCCILSTNLTSFITRGGRVERFSNSIFLNIDFPNFFLLPSLLISSHYSPFYPFLHPILCICFVILSSVQCSYRIRTYINIISFLNFSVKFLFTQISYIVLFIYPLSISFTTIFPCDCSHFVTFAIFLYLAVNFTSFLLLNRNALIL